MGFDGVATGDEGTNRVGPTRHKDTEVADRSLEGVAPGVHRSEDHLILQDQVSHDQICIDLYRSLP